jgi:RNA polymerase sigma-70 factor, ECF subfamily
MTAISAAMPAFGAFAAPTAPSRAGVQARRDFQGLSVDELALLAGVRQGDQSAWRALVERYEAPVAAVVIGMLGAGDEADDVGQETFIRFYRSLDAFRGEASLKTWLQRIATNLSLNALKRRKRGLRRFIDMDDADESTPQLQSDGAAQQTARANVELVRVAVAALSHKHRPVVVLRMIEGYSTRETAEMLGIPEGTVLSRLSRAMEQLKLSIRR